MSIGEFRYGILDLLRDYGLFCQSYEFVTVSFCQPFSQFPIINDDELLRTWELMKVQVQNWAIQQNDLESQYEYENVSHIKMAGLLLWSFNQCEPIGETRDIKQSDKTTFDRLGINPNLHSMDTRTSAVLKSCPNQACAFTYVSTLFCAMQLKRVGQRHGTGIVRSRDGTDLKTPPMTPHYFRNICRDLVFENPSRDCLYMIYKTMDLYGLLLPGSH